MEIEKKDMRKKEMRKKEMRISIRLLSEKELDLLELKDKTCKKWRETHEKIYSINHKGRNLIACDTCSIQGMIDKFKKELGEI